MSRLAAVETVNAALTRVFSLLDAAFELSPEELKRRAEYPGAWSILEHLEHVCLANHFLLLTIAKGCGKALKRAAAGEVPEGESDLAALSPIASPGAFDWQPPAHMVPTGSETSRSFARGLQASATSAWNYWPACRGGRGVFAPSACRSTAWGGWTCTSGCTSWSSTPTITWFSWRDDE